MIYAAKINNLSLTLQFIEYNQQLNFQSVISMIFHFHDKIRVFVKPNSKPYPIGVYYWVYIYIYYNHVYIHIIIYALLLFEMMWEVTGYGMWLCVGSMPSKWGYIAISIIKQMLMWDSQIMPWTIPKSPACLLFMLIKPSPVMIGLWHWLFHIGLGTPRFLHIYIYIDYVVLPSQWGFPFRMVLVEDLQTFEDFPWKNSTPAEQRWAPSEFQQIRLLGPQHGFDLCGYAREMTKLHENKAQLMVTFKKLK